jgi:benzoate-CoA ligase
MGKAASDFAPAPTRADDPCFWLYSSGSTGTPKGTVHVQTSPMRTAELYAQPILGIHESDVVFSAAKLFFAYGLGNALSFPLSVGATTVLLGERPTPAAVCRILRQYRPTIFYGVPTLYSALLSSPELPERAELNLRCCTSAGEALPPDVGRRWLEHTGVDILDGLGSTEMLHIFLSNRPGEVRYGTSGKPISGYQIRLVDEEGKPVAKGEIGELHVAGPTSAAFYWNNRDKSRSTFLGQWTKSGDKYIEGDDGYFTYCGRADDMLKVSGIWVSPFEVEAALASHEAVLEAAVVGHADESDLIKPKAFVVLRPNVAATADLSVALQQHVKSRLAPYKYPRWIEFVSDLPKTATGKIQRFKLRAAGGA